MRPLALLLVLAACDARVVHDAGQIPVGSIASIGSWTGRVDGEWRMVRRPPGSEATILHPTSRWARFLPDREGVYEVAIVVSAALGPAEVERIRVEAIQVTARADAPDALGPLSIAAAIHEPGGALLVVLRSPTGGLIGVARWGPP
jgi:hypothetical protein